MRLHRDPRCYTDVCINGIWFHYDHCGTTAYQLRGGASPQVALAKEPQTEEELLEMLTQIASLAQ